MLKSDSTKAAQSQTRALRGSAVEGDCFGVGVSRGIVSVISDIQIRLSRSVKLLLGDIYT